MLTLLARVVSILLVVLMASLIVVISAQVVMRFVFDNPLQWSLEISRILFLWIVFLGAAIAVRRGHYSAMDMMTRRLPAWWADRVIVAVMVLFSVLFAVLGTRYIRRSEIGHFTMTGLPDVIVYCGPAVAGVLMTLFSLERLFARRASAGPAPVSANQGVS